jgi:CMP-N-acetylneuraminic acid synthetase
MIAIIPARGGSKGLPRKNILPLNGIPLIAYTIQSALKSKYIDRVVVTTDNKEIADIALKYGAEVPFMRPDYLATDASSAVDVYLHAVETLNKSLDNKISDFMVLLPTVPLRTEKNIDEAVELYDQKKPDTLISVKSAPVPPSWYLKITDTGKISNANFGDGSINVNRQQNMTYYIPNGAIYILKYEILKETRKYYTDNTLAYIMKEETSVDIDNLLDFKFAELLINQKK